MSDSEQYLNRLKLDIIISPNEVFGDIMVLASPPSQPRPLVNPDDVNALSIQRISFKFYMIVNSPRGTLLLKFHTF